MFTGLIETIGAVKQITAAGSGKTVSLICRFDGEPLALGASVAVDGICVTVEKCHDDGFQFTVSPETLRRGTIGSKQPGDPVHLERALRLGDRLGGHIMQGHVDGVGVVSRYTSQGAGGELKIAVPQELRAYIVEKGSLAVHGVSLTVADIDRAGIVTLVLIPETLQRTYLGHLRPGDRLNLEVDILAKYVESMLKKKGGGLSEMKLSEWGFE